MDFTGQLRREKNGGGRARGCGRWESILADFFIIVNKIIK
jgi:hypothetical protein